MSEDYSLVDRYVDFTEYAWDETAKGFNDGNIAALDVLYDGPNRFSSGSRSSLDHQIQVRRSQKTTGGPESMNGTDESIMRTDDMFYVAGRKKEYQRARLAGIGFGLATGLMAAGVPFAAVSGFDWVRNVLEEENSEE